MSFKTTFVTCLFDCHKTNEFDKEANRIYFKNSLRTLFIEQPLIIYCDEHYSEKYYQIRKALGYEDMTIVVPKNFEDLYFYKYKDVIDNIKQSETNQKLTSELYIAWFSRYKLMLEVMENNHFNSTHFAWIDINLLSKKFNNSLNYIEPDIYDYLNEIAQNPRDKFTIQMINSWSKKSYQDLDNYFSKYRWIVACCFYTTDIETGNFIFPKLISKIEELLHLNYCQSDESIFAFLIDDYEDYFNLSIGDYQDTIHNYFTVESNHNYIDWVINRNIEKGNKTRIKNVLSKYKEFYLKKSKEFPYEHILQNLIVEDQPYTEIIKVQYRC